MKKLLFLILLSGCMVGPTYHKPEDAMPESFLEDKEQETTFISDPELIEWWKEFHDPFLNELLEEACKSNFDLRYAWEQVFQARSEFLVQADNLYPEIDLDAAATRTRRSINGTTSIPAGVPVPVLQNFYQIGFDASWEIDFFGKLRRSKRAALFHWDSVEEHARDMQLIVLSEVAKNYVTICALQKQVALATDTIFIDKVELALAGDRFLAGLKSEGDVDTLKAVLEADQASLASLQSLLKTSIYSFAVLLGKQPESMAEQLSVVHPIPIATGKVPVGLPSDLLRRRHDIRSAERQLASATESVGVAVADLFPQVVLTGSNLSAAFLSASNYSYSSTRLNNLFTPASKAWSIGPLFSLPLIDFGRRKAAIKVQKAIEQQAFITYEKTVVGALQEVESALVSYFKEEERLHFLEDQVKADARLFELSSDLYRAGLADYTQVLQAQKQLISSENTCIQSQQALITALIALYKALGGDWKCSYTP